MTYLAGKRGRARRGRVALMAALPLALVPFSAAAQDSVSRAVVQPLPPPAAAHLNEALRRLARNSQDFEALVDAGAASIELNDIDAAIGFFGRADELRPGDPRVKAGLAAAYLRADRALEAVELFAAAERAGSIPAAFAADRGLAYDLVGDNAAAQAQYRAALGRGAEDEVVRRLALSQAIAGDRRGFEATLRPLLERRDLPAYRVRAFGLAILGDEAEALSIVNAVMPPELAQRIGPYLSYMPRLTRAQQAAAANLGQFPRAAQIGRDDPRLAQYSRGSSRAADARLSPAGEPLGPRQPVEDSRSQRRRPDRGSSTTERVRPSRAERLARNQTTATASAPTAAPVAIARAPASAPSQPAGAAPPPPPPPSAPAIELPREPAPSTSMGVAASPSGGPSQPPAPGFDLARLSGGSGAGAPAQIELPDDDVPSVADAFADFTLTPAQTAAAQGAVDITAIKVRREVEKPPEPVRAAEPAKPLHPSRRWVQVATGKDLKALAFDWRRFGRKAPELLGEREAFTTRWGESRRLLTGPFESDKAAQKLVTDLKKAGLDAFTFTSDAGQEIAPLK